MDRVEAGTIKACSSHCTYRVKATVQKQCIETIILSKVISGCKKDSSNNTNNLSLVFACSYVYRIMGMYENILL